MTEGKNLDVKLNNDLWELVMNKKVSFLKKKGMLEHLIRLDADINVKKFGKSALSFALENGVDESFVQFMRENGAEEWVISKEEAHELGQLFWDSEGKLKSFSEVKELVERGADINAINGTLINTSEPDRGFSILMDACQKKGNIEMVKYLVENGANINFVKEEDFSAYASYLWKTPFMTVCAKGDKEMVEYLLDKGVDVNEHKYFSSFEMILCRETDCIDFAEMLVKRGYKIRNRDFEMAIWYKKTEVVQFLIDNGADVNCAKAWGYACTGEKEHKEIREILINKGGDINVKAKNGWSVLSCGCSYAENKEGIEHILSLGADIELKNDIGRTPLLIASQYKKRENVECLIKNGANINQKDNDGNSALMLAVKDYHFASGGENNVRDVAEVLLKNGVEVNAVNNNGETALDIARKEEKIDDVVIALLLEYGAKEGKDIEEKVKDDVVIESQEQTLNKTLEALQKSENKIDEKKKNDKKNMSVFKKIWDKLDMRW